MKEKECAEYLQDGTVLLDLLIDETVLHVDHQAI